MADFQRPTERFIYTGLTCFPADTLPPGKVPFVRNLRVYQEGAMTPRAGLELRQTIADPVHTLGRLNDPTTFNQGVPAVRILGGGQNLYRGVPTNPAPGLLDSGYSGDPLTMLSAQPPQSPRPWQYVADADQFRKFTTDGSAVNVGLAQPSDPTTEPGSFLQSLKQSAYDIQTSTAWVPAGVPASATSLGNRVNTTISQILYDAGSSGYCSIVPADPVNITVGTLLTIGDPLGSFDNAIVTETLIPIASTTVEAIIYDSGSTGLCTIQPAGSLGVGQIDSPPIAAYRRRAIREQGKPYAVPRGEAGGLPITPGEDTPMRRIRQVDFPVNCVITLGGETVRIQSVAVGTDGFQSFRCTTSGTISAGDPIVGLPAFRIALPNTHVPGEGILRTFVANTLTYPTPLTGEKSFFTAGIQSVFAINLAQFSDGTAVLPEDELHVAVNVNRLTEVRSVRVYIDVDQTVNDFLQNYFFHEWRASDIVAAVQAINAQNVQPLAEARKTVVTNQQLDQSYNMGRRNWSSRGNGRRGAQQADLPQRRDPTADTAISTQMALGNNQWIDLRVKIGTLVHVGTDPSRTLANAKAFEILLACEGPTEDVVPEPLEVQYSDLQIYGGGGPDVGEVGDPYVYCYRYRSSDTGCVSNPSPAARGGVIPRRQNVHVVATASTDPQVDRIDWFRLGGALTQYTYFGTGPNSTAEFVDDRMDSAIDGGEILSYDNFQPWPLQDLPAVGTCDVAGTAVRRVSGASFDPRWAPGSIILINGRATTLYASPSTTEILHVVDNVGSGSAVQFNLPGPTILSQPLGRFWGPYQNFYFACGDTINPGTLYWTNGNNIEATTDSNALLVTTPSEPLQAGGLYNTFPFVASSEDLYALVLSPNDEIAPIRAVRTPCGRGFWTPWAWTTGPEGIYFLAPDGLALTAGGSPAEMITTPDLRDIFPKDGIAGVATNGIPAPDMTQTTKLRLSYIAGWLYFDYVDDQGDAYTLIYDTSARRFFLDSCAATALQVRLEEPGAGVYNQIIGGADGRVFQYEGDALTDDGDPIGWDLYTRWVDGGIPRVVKQFGDLAVNIDNGGAASGVTVQPIAEDGTLQPALTIIAAGLTGRDAYIVPMPAGQFLAVNLGIQMSGVVDGDGRPTLFWWEPAFLPKAEDIATRAADWDDLGYFGAKFIQGVVIRANTYGADKLVDVQVNDATGVTTPITLTLNHDGESQVAYPLASVGWDPFIAELVRLKGADNLPWQLLGYRFVWEPAPELATEWTTQFTSTDWPGYGHLRDMVVAYEATQPLHLLLTYDDRDQTYVLPSTGGLYRRTYLVLCPGKGKAVKFKWTTAAPGRLYKRDMTVRAMGWGLGGDYRTLSPFGGPSRHDGAAI